MTPPAGRAPDAAACATAIDAPRAFGASFVEHEVAEQLTAMAAEMLRRSPR